MVPTIAMAIVMGVLPGDLPEADGAVGESHDRTRARHAAVARQCGSGAAPKPEARRSGRTPAAPPPAATASRGEGGTMT